MRDLENQVGKKILQIIIFAWFAAAVNCDEEYDKCFDRVRENLMSCGTLKDCSDRYLIQKKGCLTEFEKCETPSEF